MNYLLAELASILGKEIINPPTQEVIINQISFDSRKLHQSGNTLFVAINTNRNDGHRYLEDVYQAGVRFFLVSKLPTKLKDASYIQVDNTLEALQKLAIDARSRFNGKTIGITGSNGKTVVKEWLYKCTHQKQLVYRSPRSYNSQLGVALATLGMPKSIDLAILEAGISEPGEMDALKSIIEPNIGIFTNMRSAHAENFKDKSQHISEKLKLFKNVELLICSSNYPEIVKLAQKDSIKLFTWGNHPDDKLRVLSKSKTQSKTLITLDYQGQTCSVEAPFSDKASIENCLHVIAALLILDYQFDEIANLISDLEALEMRLEYVKGKRNCVLINDSWSADIDSLSIALEAMDEQNFEKRSLIVSDLLESGEEPGKLYAKLSDLCRNKKISRIIGVGNQISKYAELFSGDKQFFLYTSSLIEALPAIDFNNECILIKGARVFEFEKVSSWLQEKTHETVLQINLSSMISNLNYYRSLTNKKVKTMAMVKAFAYGSGSVEIAHALQFHGIDYLAVAYADEGIALRKAGISTPILVLSPETDSLAEMIAYNLEPEIYSFRMLKLLLKELEHSASEKIQVQIKLDTGMHRLGFEENDLAELTATLKENPQLDVVGIFSHLAASGEKEHDTFTQLQIDRFRQWSAYLIAELGKPINRHILNSSGVKRFPDAHFEMVRVGIGLYGIGSSDEQAFLKDVSSLKTTISQIRTVASGETIGYSRKGKVDKDSKIGTIPLGYADGFLRKLGDGNFTLRVNGVMAPTIGKVCMDMCMLDLSETDDAQEGDEVIVFENAADIKELATQLETIPYEVLTGISERVKRVYIQE